MIYFIEHDTAGNICHACGNPELTIVPLVNTVKWSDAAGKTLVDSTGADLSPYGFPLTDPIGIDETTYQALIADGLDQYACDPTTGAISKKVPSAS